MKVIVKKILKVSDIPKKDGSGSFQKTQFLSSSDDIVSVFGTTQEGAELEGDLVDTQWGKELKLSRAGSGGGFKKGGFSADPDTMLISYGKDIIIAFINAGIIKDSAAALAGLDAFTNKFFAIYNGKKNGAVKTEPKKVEHDIDTTSKSEDKIDFKNAPNDEDEEEINLDDIPFN